MDSRKCGRFRSFLRDNWFMLATILGVGIGFAIAFGVRVAKPSEEAVLWISMPGTIYLRMLQLTILPLIFSNILIVISALDPKKNGLIGVVSISYVVGINLVASIIGTVCGAIIQPGSRNLLTNNSSSETLSGAGLSASDVFRDMLNNFFPDNIVGVAIFQYRTEVINATTDTKVVVPDTPGTNMIGVLFVAISFGAAANAAKERGKAFLEFFESLSEVVNKLMCTFLKLTPVGACFMVAGSVISRENIESDFVQLGLFIATVIAGLAIHFILINIVQFIASRENPFRILKYSIEPYLISFATTSPAVAIGEMYAGLDRYGVEKIVSRFTIPMSTALKGDGPAIFITSACMFVGQQSKADLNVGSIVLICLLTFVSSLAVPNLPSASMILVVTVLSSVGIPSEGAGILFAVEWLLDRLRSGTSCLGLVYITATTQAIYERHLRKENNVNMDINLDIFIE